MKPHSARASATVSGSFISTRRALSRRQFLRGAGIVLSLPLLESMLPSFARAAAAPAKPRRMLAICNNLGLLPERFFPQQTGRGYQLSPYLELLKEHREDFKIGRASCRE